MGEACEHIIHTAPRLTNTEQNMKISVLETRYPCGAPFKCVQLRDRMNNLLAQNQPPISVSETLADGGDGGWRRQLKSRCNI